ncbi:hypothetical protein N9891_00285 [bacterium]|nr:hypothetical protein [bacterium]
MKNTITSFLKKIYFSLLPATLLTVGTIALASCQEKGPAEKAGEEIDDKVEDVKDKSEDVIDKAEDKVDEMDEQ